LGELGKTFDYTFCHLSEHAVGFCLSQLSHGQENDRRVFTEGLKELHGMLKSLPVCLTSCICASQLQQLIKIHDGAWHELHLLSQKKDAALSVGLLISGVISFEGGFVCHIAQEVLRHHICRASRSATLPRGISPLNASERSS
jgi:hypothetical protein